MMWWLGWTAAYLAVGAVFTFFVGLAYVNDRKRRRDAGETEDVDPTLPRAALTMIILFWPVLAAYVIVATILRWSSNIVKKALEWKTGEKL